MSEKMEKFIRNNRAAFDTYEPPAGLWEKIEKELDEKSATAPVKERMISLRVVLRIAAVLLVVFAAGIFLVNKRTANPEIGEINPKLGEMQVKYASMIESRRAEIKKVEKTDPSLYSEFAGEIRKMDANYQKLKGELATSPNQDETVKAMIRNLQTQLEVLNQQLTIIQEINQLKKDNSNGKQFI